MSECDLGAYPVLSHGMESSVAGLHFLGAPAALSFGPLMRFVTGSHYATTRLVRRHRPRPQRRALCSVDSEGWSWSAE